MGIEDDYDRVSYAGSSKNLINIIGQVALSNKLHGAVNIHIFHHEDCGAYGLDLAKVSKEDEILLHKKDMSCAEMEILKIIPTAKVSHYFVSLDKKVIKL